MFRVAILSAVFSLGVVYWAWSDSQEKRVALVIGNSDYVHAPRLGSAHYNAREMSKTLQRLGFLVIEGRNLSRHETEAAFRTFVENSAGADISLLYYSGYVHQTSHRSYVTPVEAQPAFSSDLDDKAVLLKPLLTELSSRSESTLALFDACRGRVRSSAYQSREGDCRALVPMAVHRNMMVSYGASKTSQLEDLQYGVSRFTESLLKWIGREQALIQNIMLAVQNDLAKNARHHQRAWTESRLEKPIILAATSQKQISSGDLEFVGRVARLEASGLRQLQPDLVLEGRDDSLQDLRSRRTAGAVIKNGEVKPATGFFEDFIHQGKLPGTQTQRAIQSLEARNIVVRTSEPWQQRSQKNDAPARVQKQLARLGCYTGRIDGIWGPKSRRALRKFAKRTTVIKSDSRPHSDLVNVLEAYEGQKCRVTLRERKTEFARRSFHAPASRVVLSSLSDPTLKPVPHLVSSQVGNRPLTTASILPREPDNKIRKKRPAVKNVSVTGKKRIKKAPTRKVAKSRSSRQARIIKWRRQTLARMINNTD